MRTWGTNWHRWRAAVTSGQVVAHNLIVAGSTMGAGVLGVAFQSLVAHRLQPVDYGGVFAVITLITFIGLPSGALTLLMARESSRDSARGDQAGSTALLAGGNRSLMIGGFLLAGVLAMGSPLLAWFLNVPITLLLAAAAGLPFALASPFLMGEFQGQERFVTLALLSISQAGLKLLAGVGLGIWLGPIGVIAGISVSSAVTYGVARWLLGPKLSRSAAAALWRGATAYLAVVVPSTLALAVLLSADVLLVKHFFPASLAGGYAAVAALGRAIYWGASGVAIVLFPKVVFRGARGQHGTSLVVASLILVAAGGLLGLGVLAMFARALLTIFAGPVYADAAGLMPSYALGMTLLGGVAVLIATHQSLGRRGFLMVLLPLTLLEPVMIAAFHESLMQVVVVVDLSMGLILASLLVLYAIQVRTGAKRPALLQAGTNASEHPVAGDAATEWAKVESL